MFLQFLFEFYSYPHSLYETRSLVVSAQGTDGIDDFVHLAEWHSVYQLIEVVEVLLQPPVVHGVGFRKSLVEHGKYGVSVSEVRWVGVDMGFQNRVKVWHEQHLQKVCVMLTLVAVKVKSCFQNLVC